MEGESDFQKCYPWIEGADKFIGVNTLRHGFDPKERELAINLMFEYESTQGFTPDIS